MDLVLTLDNYFGTYADRYEEELTTEIRNNGEHTIDLANRLLSFFGEERSINSGWRPQAINERTHGAAQHSKHITGQAIDLTDRDRLLAIWCLTNQSVLCDIGLWMEDPRWTSTWVHIQTVTPKSGNRIFIPSKIEPDIEQITFWSSYRQYLQAI